MKGCSIGMDAIADCALGRTPDPELAAHLAICAQCRDALDESRAMATRIDDALHRAAAVDPPSYGPERVMAGVIAGARTRAPWIPGWWRWTAVGSALLAASMAITMWVRRPAPVMALSAWRSPTQALLRPPVAAAWATRPRLGEGFFKIKSSGEIHAQ